MAKKTSKKLSKCNIQDIKARIAAGEKLSTLAKEFGVSRMTLWRALEKGATPEAQNVTPVVTTNVTPANLIPEETPAKPIIDTTVWIPHLMSPPSLARAEPGWNCVFWQFHELAVILGVPSYDVRADSVVGNVILSDPHSVRRYLLSNLGKLNDDQLIARDLGEEDN